MQEGIYDKFVGELAEAFKKIKVGDPTDMSTQMGAQINERQLSKILGCVEEGVSEGARVLVGGAAPLKRVRSCSRRSSSTSPTT